MINLGSKGARMNTGSGNSLKSSKSLGVKIGSKFGFKPKKIEVHTLVPSTECDFERLVIQFHVVRAHDSILTWESD